MKHKNKQSLAIRKNKVVGNNSYIIRSALKTLFGGLLLCSPLLTLAADTNGTIFDWLTSILSVGDAGKLKATIFVAMAVVGTFLLVYVGLYGFYRRTRARAGDQEAPSSNSCKAGIIFGIILIAASPFINMVGKTVGVDNAAQKASSGDVQFN
ncbi:MULTISPECIES: hypothetical protein [Cysteiniphilum]|uniref:Uncharacterized protein n=1 Tax=Cysteiniphilum litorale TaxID=2056700 RepID=A0A8J2Z2U1_9GAMM|nr:MULTISPECIES: hypothetical protein [Cysteiniphilum]GGF92368.1 hypothetical protein GCM10010995_06940 [Cysteiniphilum litorale]